MSFNKSRKYKNEDVNHLMLMIEREMKMILLHAAKEKQWNESLVKGYYGDFSITKDGFIHCSTIENILDVANDNLKKIEEPLLLLCIDTDLLEAEIKWEKRGDKEISFPHLYGLLNINAVIDVTSFLKDKNGGFYFPDAFLKYTTLGVSQMPQ